MKIRNYIAEYVSLPFGDFLTGNQVYYFLRFLIKSQWWTREEIENHQNHRLRLLIQYSVNNVPYYTNLFKELKLTPDDIKSKSDLQKIPILNKAEIKKYGISHFTSASYPRKKTMKASSSGSTGEPLFYLNTRQAYSMNIAASLRGWYWAGYRLGDKYAKLSQNPRNKFIKKIQDRFSNNLYLKTNPLTDENFKFILEELSKFKPKVIRSYPDPLLYLARYYKNNPPHDININAIFTTGNILSLEIREELESVFNCNVFDSYSCEGNSTIFECSTKECYHSTEEYGISEILDTNNNPITDGIGKLISTDLYNFVHPFIRYDTQDLVEVSSDSCSCGRNLCRINRIIGRDNDVIISPNSQRFIVHNFTGFFQQDLSELKQSVVQFQVIKKKDSSILFNLVVNDSYDQNVSDFIIKFWKVQLKLPVKVSIVKAIPLTPSGKRKFIINE